MSPYMRPSTPPNDGHYPMEVPPAPQRKRRWLPWLLGGSVLISMLCMAGLFLAVFGGLGTTAPKYPALSYSTTPVPASSGGVARKVAPAAPATIGKGTYEVPGEVQPGTYVTVAPDDSLLCTWWRLRDFKDGPDSTIAFDTLTPGARGRMTIAATDAGVKFTGSCRWRRA